MSSLERGARVPDPPRKRSAGEIIAWIVGGLLLLGLIGYIALGIMVWSAFPPLPDLYRPGAVLEGSVQVRPDADPSVIVVDLSVTPAAVEAAASGDGLVYFELDVAGAGQRPVEIEVGVTWRHRAVVVRPMAALEPGADVRWTYQCQTDEPCGGGLDLTFAPISGQSSAFDLEWRLAAEVRPPRRTEVSEDATVSLSLSEAAP